MSVINLENQSSNSRTRIKQRKTGFESCASVEILVKAIDLVKIIHNSVSN
jgi:transposase-like protein